MSPFTWRGLWLTLTSGRPCCWGASSFRVCKMRSEYLLGASAGLRRRYISIQKVQTLVMPLQWWSTLHTAVRVTAFIPLLGPWREEGGGDALLRGFSVLSGCVCSD